MQLPSRPSVGAERGLGWPGLGARQGAARGRGREHPLDAATGAGCCAVQLWRCSSLKWTRPGALHTAPCPAPAQPPPPPPPPDPQACQTRGAPGAAAAGPAAGRALRSRPHCWRGLPAAAKGCGADDAPPPFHPHALPCGLANSLGDLQSLLSNFVLGKLLSICYLFHVTSKRLFEDLAKPYLSSQ